MVCRPGGVINRTDLPLASLSAEKDLLGLPFTATCPEALHQRRLALPLPISGKGGADDMV